jgi:hypothetical protein
MDNSLRKSYSEVYEILNLMDSAYLDKIPDKVKDLITNERDKEFKTNITTDISLEKQGLQIDTLTVLAILYLNYWCESEQEKKELIELFNEVDKTNAEKYSYDNIFKKNKEIPIQEVIKENNNSLVEYKESIFSRIINKIKEIFFKNKY